MENSQKPRSSANWRKLRELLLNKSKAAQTKISDVNCVLNRQKTAEEPNTIVYQWHGKLIKTVLPRVNIDNCLKAQGEIDTTGSWVWQAEEVLAYYLCNYCKDKKYESILELGAGCSGLAALFCLTLFQCKNVVITDGRKQNLNTIDQSIAANEFDAQRVRTQELAWGDHHLNTKFELILVSDCLFFQKFHDKLLECILEHLADKGQVLFCNPSRGKSMSKFISLAESRGLSLEIRRITDSHFLAYQQSLSSNPNFDQDREQLFILHGFRK